MPFEPVSGEPVKFVFPSVHCPWCGFRLDAVTAHDGHTRPPGNGDGMVCIGCALPSMVCISVTGVVGLRRPTKPEMAAFLDQNAHLVAAVHLYHWFIGPPEK